MYKALVRNKDAFGKTWAFKAESTAATPDEAINELKEFYACELDTFESEIEVQLLL
jgi:hypothetical protein